MINYQSVNFDLTIQNCHHFHQLIKLKDMTLLLLLILIYGLDGGDCCDLGTITLTYNNSELKTTISLAFGRNITILDTAQHLTCNSTSNSCYTECTFFDLFENKTFNATEKFEICVEQNPTKTRFNFSILHNVSLCIVVDCLPDEIVNLLKEKELQMNIPRDMRNILNIKNMCQNVIFNEDVVNTYISVEKKAIHGVINMTIPEQSKNYSHEDLSLTVVKMNLSTTDNYVPITAPSVFHTNEVADTWIPVKPFQDQSENTIGVVTYDADQQFKLKLGDKSVTSKIIRIEYPGQDYKKLANPLKIQFKVNYNKSLSNYSLSCQFYDEKGDHTWKKDGCLTSNITDEIVECSCDHMTPFAVLLTKLEISKNQWEILSIISYIGCGLSAFFSASTVLSFMFNSNARVEVSSSIHVSLSGALFLLNISFMLSEWAATLNVNEVCVFIAVMIHYSLLSCFTWMAVEGLHLYLLLIRVFNIYIRHYMVKLSLVGWGVPAIVVGGLLSVQNTQSFYGTNSIRLSDTNTTNAVCWITDPRVLYGVNLTYLTVVFLINLGILISVSRQIFRRRHVGNSHGKMPVWKDAGTVLGLMCLMGTTWGLIFFSAGYNNYPILYLFCILNTMQGFFIFVWMCGATRKNRAQTSHSKTKSTQDTSN